MIVNNIRVLVEHLPNGRLSGVLYLSSVAPVEGLVASSFFMETKLDYHVKAFDVLVDLAAGARETYDIDIWNYDMSVEHCYITESIQ